MSKWIDDNDMSKNIGDVGYLVERVYTNHKGRTSFALRDRPLRTNQSHEPRLTGWCGETNNVSQTALGAWKVVRANKAGDRLQIVQLNGQELADFLQRDGHPELIP